MSVSASLFLARKVLSSTPGSMTLAEKHAQLMRTPACESPPDYIKFVESEIDKLFPIGWDKRYQSRVFQHSPTSSSCLEYPRSKGGARRWLSEQGQDWFYDQCLGECPRPSTYKVKYVEVPSGGKTRGVTISSAYAHVLGPLHRTLADHLSNNKWLLKGEARSKKFSDFQAKPGEIFVSGDYESATDNLSLEMTELVFNRIMSRCRHVPLTLRDYARVSLRAEISYPFGCVSQKRGQLMGNYLSFPLLCIQNYLTFRFAIPRSVPLRINGDDIVFRCRPAEYLTWKRNVGAAGLVLSAGKTLVDAALFSLNSAFFAAGHGRVREIPVIRSTMLKKGDGLPGQLELTRFTRNWKLDARRLVGALWLKHHRQEIQTSGRSVEELGYRADNSQLHTAGLAVREAFYRGSDGRLRLTHSPIPPIPLTTDSTVGLYWAAVPKNKLLSTGVERQRWDVEYRDACAKQVWNPVVARPSVLWNCFWDQLRTSGSESAWLAWRNTVRVVHRMGYRMLNMRLASERMPTRERRQWVPRCEVPHRIALSRGL